tara:strand:+ start:513 stop:821 length:309 start_codon:yes stop_codon:yes gene_type:complete
MQKVISKPPSTGDLVQVLSMAFAYQCDEVFFNYSLNSPIYALVLEKKKFIETESDDPSDCQGTPDSIDIQPPEWVYTLLCHSRKIEALDIDIIECPSENKNG